MNGQLMRPFTRVIVFLLFFLAVPLRSSGIDPDPVENFITRLDRRVPELLLRYNVPSAVVAVIHEEQTYSRSWGLADLKSARLPSNTTKYNVASISKLITAWTVMRLVQEGKVSLDAPVQRYLSRWKLPPSKWNREVTVRRLLSHTAGLSMAAVPQYGQTNLVPSLPAMLSSKEPVRVVEQPGHSFKYSGGGFAILQLLVEEVTKQPFARYAELAVLKPLGMVNSTFKVPEENDTNSATPYDKNLRQLPHYHFAAQGAAGLYTTANDLAVLSRATMTKDGDSSSFPLDLTTIALMRSPAKVAKPDPFGYGLGYSIVPLPVSGSGFGHAGSNDGWTSVLTTIPQSGDAIVVLLNRSDAFPVYRDLMCDWVESVQGKRWPGFCDARSQVWTKEDTAFVDQLFANVTANDPASVILVANSSGVVYRKAFGSRDVQTKTPVTLDTPFYIASLAKSFTAAVTLKLAEEGKWSLTDKIGKYVPSLPDYAKGVTLAQLLSHTSGVPDYYSLIDYANYQGMDNTKAIALLQKRRQLEFPAGSTYKYSNTGYILLASALEKITGKSFKEVLQERLLEPAGIGHTSVYDGSDSAPVDRAKGYKRAEGKYVLSDYQVVTIDGQEYPFRATTYGAGGIYSTVDDVFAMAQVFSSDKVLSVPWVLQAIAPQVLIKESLEIPDTIGAGYGWFLSTRNNVNILWTTGDMAGHKSVIVRIPSLQSTVIVMTSVEGVEPEVIALQIADRIIPKPK
ncbi:MAG: hypothetical protein DMF69_21865 [Acidobacteria bacterium]|nr:MAG: hypothetical protein DMF69_21865 [Acidobacteriota bacterium]